MKLLTKKIVALIIIDFFIINIAIIASLLIRFDLSIQQEYINIYIENFIVLTILETVVFALFGLYRSLWKYASVEELLQIFLGSFTAHVVSFLYGTIFKLSFPRTTYVISLLITFFLIALSRFSYRLLRKARYLLSKKTIDNKRIMIIGAGEAGSMVIKEFKKHPELNSMSIVAIDDDKVKHGNRINGVEVKGGRERINELAQKEKIDEIIVAIPSATMSEKHEILNICKQTKCRLKTLPGVYEIINGKVSIKNIRDVNIEDLLGREEVSLNTTKIAGYLKDETVLVTGGGGSIGSELCRQIAKHKPKQLIIFDIYENNAYEIQHELLSLHKNNINLKVIIGSVRDKKRMREVFAKYKPSIIFHAAAHKHVPLMEESPAEAVKNNVLGTLYTAQCADVYHAKKFVLISSDKAVNPTSIMGATKRIAEMIIQSINMHSNTEFAAVRFGNVLESNGSVIPLFKKQIAMGGPVTVTHPDVIRYFMTIPEAVSLVIQAGAMASGGEIYILDMGKQVKIIDLAKDLIKLSGFEPDVDIKIEFVGLRPGEKLFEELLLDEEGIASTSHEKIFIGRPVELSFKEVIIYVKTLENFMDDDKKIRECLAMIMINKTDVKDYELVKWANESLEVRSAV